MMRILLFILFVFVELSLLAQNDTLAQQTAIRNNISKYIGKPFSVLYNDLTLKPKTVWGMTATKNIYIEPSHRFYYDGPEDDSDRDIYIYIVWQPPP